MPIKKSDQHLLACLRDGDGREADALRALEASEWDGIVRRASCLQVAPILYHGLRSMDGKAPPPAPVMERLKEIYLVISARNIRLYHEIGKILSRLRAEDIPVIVLKGAHVGQLVYEAPGMRSMGDVDLLFRREDLERGQKIIVEARGRFEAIHLPVDVHDHVDLSLSNLDVDMDGVWNRAGPAVIAGAKTMVLSPEDLLLSLCLHLSSHHLFQHAGLRNLCDIHRTIDHYGDRMDWGAVVQRAADWAAQRFVHLSLLLAHDLLGAPVDHGAMARLMPEGFDPAVKAWAMDLIFDGSGYDQAHDLSPWFWALWKRRSLRERAGAAKDLLFPPRRFIANRYGMVPGAGKTAFYYVVRMGQGGVRYGRILWRILTRNPETLHQIERQNHNAAMREWLEGGNRR